MREGENSTRGKKNIEARSPECPDSSRPAPVITRLGGRGLHKRKWGIVSEKVGNLRKTCENSTHLRWDKWRKKEAIRKEKSGGEIA